MYLSADMFIEVDDVFANYAAHMCYVASKLWNACNWERKNHKPVDENGLMVPYPDFYEQEKTHKDDIWYKSLPSQTAQRVCSLLDGAWKSFFTHRKHGNDKTRPPRYKQESMPISYMQNGMKRMEDGSVRLALPKRLKEHMSEKYGLGENFLFLRNQIAEDAENIKQVTIYPPEGGRCRAIIVYEIKDPELLEDNGHYLSIDLGVHNFMTCYDSDGFSFIAGREYLSIQRKYLKEIGRVRSEYMRVQNAEHTIKVKKGRGKNGKFYPTSTSKHIKGLYEKKTSRTKDYLHKMTREIADYCAYNGITKVIVGDITGIRKKFNKGKKANQNFHSMPYLKAVDMLGYKLRLAGIELIRVCEAWSSQCPPDSPEVSKKYAEKENRVKRGLYVHKGEKYNADTVGAYNILRLACQENPFIAWKRKPITKTPTQLMRVRA